jgi:hypothetical protein
MYIEDLKGRCYVKTSSGDFHDYIIRRRAEEPFNSDDFYLLLEISKANHNHLNFAYKKDKVTAATLRDRNRNELHALKFDYSDIDDLKKRD